MRHSTATTDPAELLGEKVWRKGGGGGTHVLCSRRVLWRLAVAKKKKKSPVAIGGRHLSSRHNLLQGMDHVKSYKHLLVPPFNYNEMKACLEYYVQEKWISVCCVAKST